MKFRLRVTPVKEHTIIQVHVNPGKGDTFAYAGRINLRNEEAQAFLQAVTCTNTEHTIEVKNEFS